MKLPQLAYKAVQGPRGQDASVALQEFQVKRQVTQAATDLGKTIALTKQKYDITRATKTATDEMSRFNRTTGQKQVFTADEVRELGLEDSVNLKDNARLDEEGNAMDRADIPAAEVYPIALENKLNDVITASAGGIGGGAGRNNWESQMRLNATKAVESSHIRAQGQMREYDLATRMLDLSESKRLGNWPGVHMQINDLPTDENTKRELRLEAKQEEEIEDIREVSRSGNVVEIRALAEALVAGDYPGDLTSDTRDSESAGLKRYANSVEKAEAAQLKEIQKAKLTRFWVGYSDAPDPATIPDWMEPGERRAALKFAESAGKPTTDMGAWYKLDRLSTSDPEKFADVNLMLHRGELSNADFQKFAGRQRAIETEAPETTNLRTFEQQISGALMIAGVDEDKKEAEIIRRIISEEIILFETENKRKATFLERQVIVDKLTIDKPWDDPKKWGFGGFVSSTRETSVSDIKADTLIQIQDALRASGQPLTQENILDTYIIIKRGR